MTQRLSLAAAAAALGLHAALVVGVLSIDTDVPARHVEPVQVTLKTLPEPLPAAPEPVSEPPPPPPPEPAPPPPPPPPPPEPAPPPPESVPPPKKKVDRERPRTTKPAPKKAVPKEEPPSAEPSPAPAAEAPRPPSTPSPPAPSLQPAAPVPPSPPAPAAPPAPPVRTGISIPATHAASNRKPVYPPMSQRYGEEGTVVLRVYVQADGTAGKVEIKKSSGFPLLDESARSAVATWRFNPATVDGKPVSEWYEQSIPFTLQD